MSGKSEYKNKWISENKERITLIVEKGQKSEIQAAAEATGESTNGYITKAIAERMKRNKAGSEDTKQ